MKKIKWYRYFISVILLLIPSLLVWVVQAYGNFQFKYWTIFTVVITSSLLSTFLQNKGNETVKKLLLRVGANLIICGTFYAIGSRLVYVNAHPFPLYWSEGNRFFDYSTLFGSFRYQLVDGSSAEAFITPGMALPWSFPFLYPDLSILAFRLYYQLMWVLPAILLGYIAWQQLGPSENKRLYGILFGLWVYLFIEQGPVYVPLIFVAMLVVLAVRTPLVLSMLLVLCASIYAHFSRWTWSYAPSLWAGLLSLLRIEAHNKQKMNWRVLKKPILLGLTGIVGGLVLPFLFGSEMARSLVNPMPFTARQPLLWERLLPSMTYKPGILLGLLWAAGQVLALIIALSLKKYWQLHWLQKSALIVSLLGFFVVGMIASIKIGGGSNLHNLDMFLLVIVLILPIALQNTLKTEDQNRKTQIALVATLVVVMVGPVSFLLQKQDLVVPTNSEITKKDLNTVQQWSLQASERGEVLFIDHRQLLTFGDIDDIPLVEEYEKKLLMEMAMSERLDYFVPFYRDLVDQRFTLIINEPSGLFIKGAGFAFSEENNAFVEWVTLPLLCNYYPVYTSKENNLELLLPRTSTLINDERCVNYIEKYGSSS